MSSQPREMLPNGLPDVQRIITDHNPKGESIVSQEISTDSVWESIGMADFFVGYTTRKFPVILEPSDAANPSSIPEDVQSYKKDLESPLGLSISTGTVVRYVDVPPNSLSPMHRTASLDYGFVLEGEMELVLDSGETRLMRRGDVCVQRATNHAWRNVTPNNGPARMVYVLVGAEIPKLNGKVVKEELGDLNAVIRASD